MNPCPLGGLQVLIPINSASSTRTSWPPKCTESLPLFDPMVVDLTEQENIHIGLQNDVYATRGSHTLRGPGIRGSQPIPNRTSRFRTPSIRTPPPGLWQVAGPKPPTTDPSFTPTSQDSLQHPLESPSMSPVVTELPPTSRRSNPQRRFSIAAQAPIGSERLRRLSMLDDVSTAATRVSPGKTVLVSNSDERATVSIPSTSVSGMPGNTKRHPHTPSMVSMFNPLREAVPPRSWLSSLTPVPSQRFRTPLFFAVTQERSRRRCNMKHGSSGESKTIFLTKKRLNCPTCKSDSFLKRLMLFKYPLERLDHLQHIERMNLLISPTRDEFAMDVEIHLPNAQDLDMDILDGPFLRDLDDFDEGIDDFFDKDGDPILVDDDGDTDMKGLALF